MCTLKSSYRSRRASKFSKCLLNLYPHQQQSRVIDNLLLYSIRSVSSDLLSSSQGRQKASNGTWHYMTGWERVAGVRGDCRHPVLNCIKISKNPVVNKQGQGCVDVSAQVKEQTCLPELDDTNLHWHTDLILGYYLNASFV